ncbi:MAG: metallophosphoesterase [Pseudomonadota bacterium]|nr:metallophosphoesterase [Pseudomonadota bacterium]
MLGRIAFALGLFGAFNLYFVSRLIARWPWAERHLGVVSVLALGFFILQLTSLLGHRLLFPALKRTRGADTLILIVDWVSFLAFGAMSLFTIYTLLGDVFSIVWLLVRPPADLPAFDADVLKALLSLVLGTMILGVGQASTGPVVRRVTIPIKGLPAAFAGVKIVQISDLHVGPTIRENYVQKVVDTANSLTPDLVALTGDFADGAVEDVGHHMAPLASLKAPLGTFFVTGNHEYYWGPAKWIAYFRSLGAQVLLNDHVVLRRDGAALILAGITDYSTAGMALNPSDPSKALKGAPNGLVKILLAHQPASYRAAQAAGFDLQLSGHTHGGQYFPFNFLIRFFQTYYKGLNRAGSLWVYVNRGTGYWGPPLRAGVPAEITLLTLRPEVSN